MRLTRCFVPPPLRAGSVVTIPVETAARLTRVLRLRPGTPLTLFDGRGGEYQARLIEAGRSGVRAQVGDFLPIEREASLQLILLQCLARAERMDWIVQKATELGVAIMVPVASRYSVVQLDGATRQRRMEHWRAVIVGACEQCGRNRPPALHDVCDVPSACAGADPDGVRLLLSPTAALSLPAALAASHTDRGGRPAPSEPGETGTQSRTRPTCVTLLIGPEGGLAAEELEAAARHGFTACRLGPRILRAETAPLASLATIQAIAGDFV